MRLAGIGLLVPALLVVVHAASMQRARARKLDERAVTDHFDRVGPTMLTFLLSLSVLFNLVATTAHQLWAGRAYLGNGKPSHSVPISYWVGGCFAALAGAALVTIPSTCLNARESNGRSSGLSQPFLEGQPKSVSSGPLRPKLLYANERTFIHWSHLCTLLSSTSMAVTSSARIGETSGLAAYASSGLGWGLSLVALALLAYAHHTYHWRAARIIYQADQRCDDPLGPQVLAGALLVALVGGTIALLFPSEA